MTENDPKGTQKEGNPKCVRGPQAQASHLQRGVPETLQERSDAAAAIIPVPSGENAQERSRMNTARQPGGGASPGRARSKSHLDYWRARVKRPRYSRNGQWFESPHWSVELQSGGRRANWSLGTSNRDSAAALAREIYLFLGRHGWEATRARYRPRPEKKIDLTVGEYLQAVQTVASQAPRTLESYARSLRKIVADVFKIRTPTGQSKYDYVTGGYESWKNRIEAIRLAKLTPATVQAWKLAFIAKAGTDPLAIRRARNSVNSFLRQAKSLFSTELLGHLRDVELPSPLPFEGVTFEPRQSNKYYSTIDPGTLITKARAELASLHPEAFKIFLLGLFCGLRRREIDLLEWTAFGWNDNTLRIAPTKYFQPKSEDSIGTIPIEPELLAIFRGFRAKSQSSFVVSSDVPPRPGALYHHYRCTVHFDFLANWLRTHGVDGLKPLHTLRKEFGSQLCANLGIYAASRGLRHSAIAVTAEYYTDSTARGTVGLGYLLADSAAGKIVPIAKGKGSRKRRKAS
jgi:integrase